MGILKVLLNGDVGGQGVSKFYAVNAGSSSFSGGEANSFGSALHTLYDALKALFPVDMTYQVDSVVENVDIATAALVGLTNISSVPAAVVGTASQTYVAGTGIRGYWHTSTIKNRRLVRGATFFTPITSNDYTTAGLISTVSTSGTVTAMNAYTGNLGAAGLTQVIYSRPKPKGATNGSIADVIAATCSVTPSSLRSRRS
jgi:hypothetical protein